VQLAAIGLMLVPLLSLLSLVLVVLSLPQILAAAALIV
jgi:hypothetical protein